MIGIFQDGPRLAKMASKYLFSKWPLMRQDGLKMAQNIFFKKWPQFSPR